MGDVVDRSDRLARGVQPHLATDGEEVDEVVVEGPGWALHDRLLPCARLGRAAHHWGTLEGRWTLVALFAALLAACDASDEETQVLKLSVETAPGVVRYDKERLSAKAGRIAFELTNDRRKGHNIRIHTGDTCCFQKGSKDIGGTPHDRPWPHACGHRPEARHLHISVFHRRLLAHAAWDAGGAIANLKLGGRGVAVLEGGGDRHPRRRRSPAPLALVAPRPGRRAPRAYGNGGALGGRPPDVRAPARPGRPRAVLMALSPPRYSVGFGWLGDATTLRPPFATWTHRRLFFRRPALVRGSARG